MSSSSRCHAHQHRPGVGPSGIFRVRRPVASGAVSADETQRDSPMRPTPATLEADPCHQYLERVEGGVECRICFTSVDASVSCTGGHRVCGTCFKTGAQFVGSEVGGSVTCLLYRWCKQPYVVVVS